MKPVPVGRSISVRAVTFAIAALVVVRAAPLWAAGEGDFVTLTADSARWYPGDKVVASGNVQAAYKEYKVTADSAEADLQTNLAVFQGHVKLTTRQHTVQGERLTINLKTKDWNLETASSRLTPETFQGQAAGPAFVRGSQLSGSGADLKVVGGTFTTCDLEHPHYLFSAKEIEIHPESRIIARKVSIVGLDRRLFTLNSLVIPIKGFRYNIIPQVGSSADEGMFIKTAYAYTATDRSQGFLKLDLMQKRGVGAGIEHSYQMTGGSGRLSLYSLADRQLGASNLTGLLEHQQKLGSLNLALRSDYRTNNYLYFPSSTTENSEIVLSHAMGPANTTLSVRRNANRGFGDYTTLLSSLRHTQQFGEKLSGMLSMDMRTYRSSGFEGLADRELESVLELRHREDRFDLSLVASKRNDLDGDEFTGDDFYSSLDRLPELTFETDSYRLGDRLLLGFPARLCIGAGRYHEEPSGATSDRLLLQLDLLSRTLGLGKRNDLNVSAGFRQSIYAQDTAQYILKTNTVLTTRMSDYLKTRLVYNYQAREGFSPFRFDYSGEYNYIRAIADYRDEKKLRWSLGTGYDLKRDRYPWQDLTLRLSANPKSSLGYSLSTGYDLNRSKWRNLIARLQIADRDRFGLDLGTRYDMDKGRLERLRSRFDVGIGSKWHAEGLVGWSGVTKSFDYRAFRLIRDLHCWEASLVYTDEFGFRKDRGLRLDLRIKAFPGTDRFGIGQYGQAIDTSMGEYYY